MLNIIIIIKYKVMYYSKLMIIMVFMISAMAFDQMHGWCMYLSGCAN